MTAFDHSRFSETRSHRISYLKTILAALTGAVVSLSLFIYLPPTLDLSTLRQGAAALFAVMFVLCAIPLSAGFVVLYRDARDRQNRPDIFHKLFSRVPSCTASGWRRLIRPLLGSSLRPGDLVRVRGPDEIAPTLDESGRLEGLPFMPEMLAHCGQLLMVDRRIDKINDWMAGNQLRRTKDIVTLVDIRCGGSDHGSCQAACQILWKERWLCRTSPASFKSVSSAQGDDERRTLNAQTGMEALEARLKAAASQEVRRAGQTVKKYSCQITELVRASSPMNKYDLRQDIRPLLNGNVSLSAFLIALLTRIFNKVQAIRGGVGYPVMAPQLDSGPTPVEQLNLDVGETVRVRSKHEICSTLHRNHNRGMWFGRETLRFCNQQCTVRSHVHQIIHERSGEMVAFRVPGVILHSVTGTGEFLRFCPQNEFVFWREIWLERINRQ